MTTAVALLASAAAASAHIVLEQPRAPAGSSYRAVFRVGHGCDGLPTRGISVRIPAGVRGAKPMPKPGWRLSVRTAKLEVPFESHGKRIESDVTEIGWSAVDATSFIADAWYDEFVLRATLPAEPGALWFQVVQTCDDNGREVRKAWVQIPKEGTSIQGLPEPAALLQVDPAAAAPAGHVH